MEAKKRKLMQQGAEEDTIDSFELAFSKQISSVQSELSQVKSELLATKDAKYQAELKALKCGQG